MNMIVFLDMWMKSRNDQISSYQAWLNDGTFNPEHTHISIGFFCIEDTEEFDDE